VPFRFPLRRIASHTFAPLTAALLAACSGGDGGNPVIPPPPAQPAWRWMNPVSEGASLHDVWGPSADNLFAAGDGGVVMRYDGAEWRRTTTPVSASLNAIWGTSADHVVAVGEDGTILFYNGSAWIPQTSNTFEILNDVWGSSATDIYAVGFQRTVVHYDGTAWSVVTVPVGFEPLRSVWGSGPNDVYATGLGKDLLHYDGTAWNPIATGSTFALTAVWGTAADDVFAVGGNGAVAHYDGTTWTNIDVGEPLIAQTVWGTATNDVYVMGYPTGEASQAYHWDGLSWSPVEVHSRKEIDAVFGVDGAVVAVGWGGTIHEKAGDEFLAVAGGMTVDLEDVCVSASGSDAFAVGELGTILHFTGGAWSVMESGTTENLRGLDGTSASDLLAVGENGTALHYDGARWSDISAGGPHLNEAWMDGPGTAYVVGDGGTALRYHGTGWTPVGIGFVLDPLLSVWGSSGDDIWLVGAQSTVLRWNGTQWKNVVVDVADVHNFQGVHGTGPDDVFLASEYVGPASSPLAGEKRHAGGLIFHWDGTSWGLPVYQDPVHDVLSVWRANASEGYATGNSSSLLRNAAGDGGWIRVGDLQNLPFMLTSVWGSSMGNVFVVGDNGTIARLSPSR
jgi:photosystem II stability/assembly factor-like uncharacterized protein